MARDIHRQFKAGPIVALCILKGGYQFFKDLLQHIKDLNANSGNKCHQFWFDWFDSIWFDLITFDSIWFDLIPFDLIWFHLIWFDSIWFHLIWFDSIWFDLIPFDLIWFPLIWFDLILFDYIWFDLIWFCLITFDSIWFDLIWFRSFCSTWYRFHQSKKLCGMSGVQYLFIYLTLLAYVKPVTQMGLDQHIQDVLQK